MSEALAYEVLDLGYGPRLDDQMCRVMKVHDRDGLFGDREIWFEVKIPSGEPMSTHGFDTCNKVSISFNKEKK